MNKKQNVRVILFSLALLSASLPAAAAAQQPPPRDTRTAPLIPCPEGVEASSTEAAVLRCSDPLLVETANERILALKSAAANAYAEWQAGRGSREQLEMFEGWLTAMTGEEGGLAAPASSATPALPAPGTNARAATSQNRLSTSFWPFHQINVSYCGPAAIQSILNFLRVKTSAIPNGISGNYDTMTGDVVHDQSILASDYWLATDTYDGTNWGVQYVPFTLNAWRGNRWYVQSSSPWLEEGTLTSQQALNDIKYVTDRSLPVAENVLYSSATYYPPGFWPGVRYEHWDTVYGHSVDGDTEYVHIGQTYHDERLEYGQFAQVAWDVHWRAIEAWHGIVW